MFLALKEKLFGNMFGKAGNTSKSLAKSRLHFVLIQDRTGMTNDEMGSFKKELVSVIEKYFVIDKTGFDIDYKREGETTTLLINSPVIVKRQESIGGDVGSKKTKGGKKDKDSKEETKEEVEAVVPQAATTT